MTKDQIYHQSHAKNHWRHATAIAQVEVIRNQHQPTNWNDLDLTMRRVLFESKIWPQYKGQLPQFWQELIDIEIKRGSICP